MKKKTLFILFFILLICTIVSSITLMASSTIPVSYYILRDNLVRPVGNSHLNWNGYWRVGYGSILSSQEVYDDELIVQNLLSDIPDCSKFLNEDQHIEWYTIRKTSAEWRVEGEVVSDTSIEDETTLHNALFYLLDKDISRPDTDKRLSHFDYFTELGYGTINTTDSYYIYKDQDSTSLSERLIYVPDCSSYLAEDEYVEWYSIRDNNGCMEVEGEVLSINNSIAKSSSATYYLADLNAPDTYIRIGYGSITNPTAITNDTEQVLLHLNSIPCYDSYVTDGAEIRWHTIRQTSDSTLWRVDGYIIPSTDETPDFIKVNGRQIVDSTGKPFQIKGIGFGNNVWYTQNTTPITDHDEASYAELADLGFNSVRFYLNASLFEKDSAPYVYDDTAWAWLDQNVEWAKKYNIRLLLNMHIPQGGKIKSSNTVFWDDIEYQNRFVALWKAIAERYASEDSILGYGLFNEPFTLECSSSEESLDLYYNLINRTIQEIRSVDTNHMFFIERPYGVVNAATNTANYIWGTTDSFRLVLDNNTVYEFHFYEPTNFTHQGLSWLNYREKWTYNSSTIALLSGNRTLGKIYKSTPTVLDTSSTNWQHLETALLTLTDSDVNYGYWIIYLHNMGISSNIYIDNIEIKEYDSSGIYLRTLLYYDFNTVTPCAGWDLGTGGGGTYNYSNSDGINSSGCAKISDVTNAYRFYRINNEANINFQLNPTNTYKISADIRLENTSPNFSIELGLQSAICDKVYSYDKEYLRAKLQPFLTFSFSYNVPLYLGEFGVSRYVMTDEYHGDEWIRDTFDLLNEYSLGYSYHDYHEENFGLYINDSRLERNERNEALYNIFLDKVK